MISARRLAEGAVAAVHSEAVDSPAPEDLAPSEALLSPGISVGGSTERLITTREVVGVVKRGEEDKPTFFFVEKNRIFLKRLRKEIVRVLACVGSRSMPRN